MPVLEKPDDLVALASGENELTGFAEALEVLVRFDDLAQRGCRGSSWNVVCAEPGIEACNGLDDARPALDHFVQAGTVHPESRVVQHVDGDRRRRKRDRRHDPDREQKDARALGHEKEADERWSRPRRAYHLSARPLNLESVSDVLHDLGQVRLLRFDDAVDGVVLAEDLPHRGVVVQRGLLELEGEAEGVILALDLLGLLLESLPGP